MVKSNKKQAKRPPAQPNASHQRCSICQSISDRCAAFWKGGELRGEDLPAAASRLSIVGAPFMDDDTGSSNACLKQCPECGTYYDWRFTYEYLFNGSEDEVVLTRISQAAGREWARRIAQAMEAYQAQFTAAAPQHIDALLHAPRHPDLIKQAVDFFWQGQRKGCDITFALPALIRALARISRKRDAAGTIKLTLSGFGSQSQQRLQLVREQLQASGTSRGPDIESLLTGCETLMRAN